MKGQRGEHSFAFGRGMTFQRGVADEIGKHRQCKEIEDVSSGKEDDPTCLGLGPLPLIGANPRPPSSDHDTFVSICLLSHLRRPSRY